MSAQFYINHLQNCFVCIWRVWYIQIRNQIYKMRIKGIGIFFSHWSLLIQNDCPTRHYMELNPSFGVYNVAFSFFIDISNALWTSTELVCLFVFIGIGMISSLFSPAVLFADYKRT